MSETIRYIEGDKLDRINNDAVYYKRNRSVDPKYLKSIIKAHNNNKTKFPILFSMIHNDNELRLQIHTGVEDMEPIWIDCNIKFEKFIKSTTI